MSPLQDRNLLLGVTGGIAAYKSAELVRLLRRAGARVRVVMTGAAGRFITPMTLQALSGEPVRQELFDPAHEAAMGHIELARWADRILIAPASADFMARLAAGIADDLLSTICLATGSPVIVAPAMNQGMWRNPATRENAALLQRRGVVLWGPAEGEQACGEQGPGRMLEPADLLRRLERHLAGDGRFAGRHVLLTAGPTREALDPVRYLTNRSSGKMGYALAEAFLAEGAQVTLVSGPVALPPPAGAETIAVESALEMEQAVLDRVNRCDLFVACAAVADYRPRVVAGEKIKKRDETLGLELVRNPDILARVAALPAPPFTVGFAAETSDPVARAEEKRRRKGVDMIAANLVGAAEGGFERDDNALTVLWEGGHRELPLSGKRQLADRLVALIAERYEPGN
ncbi:MAG TPA: bifunctional phosphopantothenoylcysteine decarboxylase/phosphopantothenate--cysteine ligase CoaBC [Sedimenticola thiotaurini]|uniref:Coenzyme A biosynthesis bifunctional protein CoaBC n=1 Tax=Sedimenticola thiotaurini TaxID=1543721 RepID=A0A831RNK6_9GAMM|nr:bifunctional phosphopantothenoylcysteine decarboxylase/phosphopantothenate--cysteine ligase CoaBC [Sedimenticola thiotaurini]